MKLDVHSRERRGAGTRVGMEQGGGALLPFMAATRHFTEHMSCEEVAGVGRVFGLVPG